jgi:hypothetical protein
VTFSTGTAWVVGGTSAASVTCEIWATAPRMTSSCAASAVELVVVEGEPRQPREVRDLVAGDLGHAAPSGVGGGPPRV